MTFDYKCCAVLYDLSHMKESTWEMDEAENNIISRNKQQIGGRLSQQHCESSALTAKALIDY